MNTLPLTVAPEDTKHMGINFNMGRIYLKMVVKGVRAPECCHILLTYTARFTIVNVLILFKLYNFFLQYFILFECVCVCAHARAVATHVRVSLEVRQRHLVSLSCR